MRAVVTGGSPDERNNGADGRDTVGATRCNYAEGLHWLGFVAGGRPVAAISLGGTLVTSKDQSIDDVITRADEALYLAKNQGRNRVVLLTDEPDEKPEKGSAQAEAPSA